MYRFLQSIIGGGGERAIFDLFTNLIALFLYDPTNKIATSLALNGEKLSKDYLLNIIYKNKIANLEAGKIVDLYKSVEFPLKLIFQ